MADVGFVGALSISPLSSRAFLGSSSTSRLYPPYFTNRRSRRSFYHSNNKRRVIRSAVVDEVGHFNVRVLVPIADGSEEIETMTLIDVLRRAGANVTIVSCSDYIDVKMAQGVSIKAEKMLKEIKNEKEMYHAVAIPGGQVATERMSEEVDLLYRIQGILENNGIVAASCSAPPNILVKHGLMGNSQGTCYPSPPMEYEMGKGFKTGKVVVDGQFVTGQGPATAMQWSLKLVELLFGKLQADALSEALLLKEPAVV